LKDQKFSENGIRAEILQPHKLTHDSPLTTHGSAGIAGAKKETHLSIPIEKVGLALNNSLT
jgi:hypothetical protein